MYVYDFRYATNVDDYRPPFNANFLERALDVPGEVRIRFGSSVTLDNVGMFATAFSHARSANWTNIKSPG